MPNTMGSMSRSHPTNAAVMVAALAVILVQVGAFNQFALREFRPLLSPASSAPGFVNVPTTTSRIRPRPIAMASSECEPSRLQHQVPEDRNGGSTQAAPTAVSVTPFSLPTVLGEGPLCILDPHVRETEKGYALTFNLPLEVTEDGLDVSVSGRLLTIEARVTQETKDKINSKSAGDRNKGLVVNRRATRTYAAARSFPLPNGVFNQVSAFLVADGVVEVHLAKVASGLTTPEEHRHRPHHDAYYPASSSSGEKKRRRPSLHSAMEDSGGVPVERRCDQEEPSTRSSGAESSTQRRSLLAALDEEFRDLAKAMWTGEDAVRFPTEEQVAATVERAREERKKRVTALRRATMATSVSEKERAYVVRVALPSGATRDDVKLMVTPDNNGLRVTFSTEGHRAVSKAVRLPYDALFEDISATFTPEAASDSGRNRHTSASKNKKRSAVSGLEITVGRLTQQQPKSIEIK